MRKGIIIGICGPSCSGKTTASDILAKVVGGKVFHFDDYYLQDASHVMVNGALSYERPELYDGKKLAQDMLDHATQNPSNCAIAEGFMIFNHPEVFELCDVKTFLSLGDSTILMRRKARAAKRGYDFLGGRQSKFEHSFLCNGIEEWRRFGVKQANLPDVQIINGLYSPADIVQSICSHPTLIEFISNNAKNYEFNLENHDATPLSP